MAKRCCCFYAPTIIVLDLVLLLIHIGELVIVFPDRKVSVTLETGPLDIWLWEAANYSVFVIPANTLFVSLGLRILFCKLHLEYTKVILLIALAGLYVSTSLGLVCYVQAPKQDLYKQNFFLQYIIMAVALVLGFLTLFIAAVVFAVSFMRHAQASIGTQAKRYQEEHDDSLRQLQARVISSSNQVEEPVP